MAKQDALTRRFQLACPVIQAPMAGGGDTADLVGAVGNAGGIGFIGAAYLSPQEIIERGAAVRRLTSRPFGINLFAPSASPLVDSAAIKRALDRIAAYYAELGLPAPTPPSPSPVRFDDQLAAALETGAAALSFALGSLPQDSIAEIKRRGAFCIGTATTVNEARQLAAAGVDAVVAQGSEAGGHRSTFEEPFEAGMVGAMALVPQVVDAVPVPVIASGGIMDGRGIGAALMLGASAVQMGTAFLACDESGIPPCYKEAICLATEEQTRITHAFSGRPARGIVNRLSADYQHGEADILPFPLQNALTRPLRSEAARKGRAEFLSLWAGQGLRLARRGSAADLLRALQAELQQALANLQS